MRRNKLSSLTKKASSKFHKSKSIILLLLIIVWVAFLFSPFFYIKNISVLRTNIVVDSASIETTLINLCKGENLIFTDTKKIQDEIKKIFPQWKNIILTKKIPNTLQVDVRTFLPIAKVKLKAIHINENDGIEEEVSKTVIINEKWSITEKTLENPMLTIIYKDLFKNNTVAGENIIHLKHMNKILFIKKTLLEDYDLTTKNVDYFNNAREAYFDLFKYILWFDLEQDISIQFDKFDYILNNVDMNLVEYVDLRISNRIIYK